MPRQIKRIYPELAGILAVLFWGSNYIVVTKFLPEHAIFTGAVRSLGGALPLLCINPRMPPRKWWGKIALLGTLNCGAFFGLLFVSALRLPGGIAGTLQSLGPTFTIIVAWPLLGQRPSTFRLGLVLAGALGVSLLLASDRTSFDIVGVAAGLGAALCLAIGGILLNRWPRPAPLLIFTAWQLAIGGLELGVLAFVSTDVPSGVDLGQFLSLCYLAVASTTIAYSLWFYCIEAAGASVAAPFLLLSPVVAFSLDAAFRALVPTVPQAIGAAIVLASLLGAQLRR